MLSGLHLRLKPYAALIYGETRRDLKACPPYPVVRPQAKHSPCIDLSIGVQVRMNGRRLKHPPHIGDLNHRGENCMRKRLSVPWELASTHMAPMEQ